MRCIKLVLILYPLMSMGSAVMPRKIIFLSSQHIIITTLKAFPSKKSADKLSYRF